MSFFFKSELLHHLPWNREGGLGAFININYDRLAMNSSGSTFKISNSEFILSANPTNKVVLALSGLGDASPELLIKRYTNHHRYS